MLYGRAGKAVQGTFFEDHSHCGEKDVDGSIQAQNSGLLQGIVSKNLDLFVFEMDKIFLSAQDINTLFFDFFDSVRSSIALAVN